MKKLTYFILILLSYFFSCNIAYAKEKAVPILTYHSITYNQFTKHDKMYVKPDVFENQIKMILQNGFTPIFASDMKYASSHNKPVVITFDDGYIDNYEVVFPIIKKYNVKITIFVITDFLNRAYYLKPEYVREMDESGLVSIQSHTFSHKRLTELNAIQLEGQLRDSKKAIIDLINKTPIAIAYPFGEINNNQIRTIKKYYEYGFTTSSGLMSNGGNKYVIKRFQVNNSTNIDTLLDFLNSF